MANSDQETSSHNTQHWTPDRIKVETELFLLDGGKLSPLSFKRRKREDLLNHIETSYPGGLSSRCHPESCVTMGCKVRRL